jgi:pimeloyl-ACP methyl ester carboxylesterase
MALFGLALGLAAGTFAIYWNVAASSGGASVAFPFVVVPIGSWFLVATILPIVGLMSRGLSRCWFVRWTIRTIAAACLLVVVGVSVLLGLLLLDHNRETILPEPTGPFPVGRTRFVWQGEEIDPAAPSGTKRQLLVWIWYPAPQENPSEPVDDYLPAAWRTAVENQSGVLLSQFLTRDLSRVRAHSLRDPPVSPRQPLYPVVLMRGGGAALTTDYTTLAEDLASHGYVVVGFDVPYRSWVAVLPDGTVVARALQNNLDNFDGPQADRLAETLARAWTADCRFLLDQLERLNASDSPGTFRGRLDLERLGMFGHSLGGATALLFCHDDPRCKAGIDVDGAPLGPIISAGVSQPFMFIVSDHSREWTAGRQPEFIRHAMANIRSIFERLPDDRRLMVEIRGANHFLFSDNGALLKSPFAMRLLRGLGIVRIDGRRQLTLTVRSISSFFDVYLKGAPASRLKEQIQSPEIQEVPSRGA